MNRQHRAILNVIHEFKPDDISDLEAALNVITNHAAQIRELTDRIAHLESVLAQIGELAAHLNNNPV